MGPWSISVLALISTFVCLFLWFKDVRHTMREHMSIVESAASQLAVYQEKANNARDDSEITEVFTRSKEIYRQAIERYNRTLLKPWNYLPAYAMGFRKLSPSWRRCRRKGNSRRM